MFAPHELPLNSELVAKYRTTARAAFLAAIEALREPSDDALEITEDDDCVRAAERVIIAAEQRGAQAEFDRLVRIGGDQETLAADLRDVYEPRNYADHWLEHEHWLAIATFVAALIGAEREKQAWRPIETAPKDGRWILGWAACDSSPYRISWGRNHNGKLSWCSVAGSFVEGYITHWQDLTPPIELRCPFADAGECDTRHDMGMPCPVDPAQFDSPVGDKQ